MEESSEKKEAAVGYVHTAELPEFFAKLQISLLASTYQAQRVMTLASNGEKLSMLMRVLERPTGIALRKREAAIVTKRQIWFFRDSGVTFDSDGVPLPYDLCLVPRQSFVTGDIAGHECGWHNDELLVLNTRFSCISRLDPDWSFVPTWRPKFISSIAAEDRCHLNGFVIDESGPRFVTALGQSDEAEGWREKKVSGGIIIDVPSGEILSEGIAMPHSPRWYAGKLWVLESGTGSLQVVDLQSGKRTTVVRLPGYLRGLSFYDRFAFVGLCKIRGDRDTFGGMPIEENTEELKCAIYVIDITSGAPVGFIEFTKGIEELFDVHVLPSVTKPHIIGFEEDTLDGMFIVDSANF